MRALALLLLCVVLLAVMQASYIVAEAKSSENLRRVDDVDSKLDRKQQRNRQRKEVDAADVADDAAAKDSAASVDDLNPDDDDDTKAKLDMPEEQQLMLDMPQSEEVPEPSSERSGRRERVSKEEQRRARKEGRQRGRKEERRARKEARQARRQQQDPEERAERKQDRQERKQGREERKQDRADRKAARQAKKAERQGRNNNNNNRANNCTSDSQCQEDECCMPGRGGVMACRSNRRPRALGRKCVTSCTCEGDMECYQEQQSGNRRKQRNRSGKCVAADSADLTNGKIITAESLANP